ncbi:MAG: 4Fe-4S dicluster domain-containing protein [Desulfitobacteriaceae bacterium]|nr:4Fe-4S dicluster domain-containing protein [Desulfitobacteriaceae bacterium]
MHEEYVLEHCRPNCPKAARNWSSLVKRLESGLSQLGIGNALKRKFGVVQYHHLPKITVAGCPNGCSRPQIKDLGMIGFVEPGWDKGLCNGCQGCVAACLEEALAWDGKEILIDALRCLQCGDCLRVCPTGALSPGKTGWRLLQGGRVGRHPRFADVSGTATEDQEAEAWALSAITRYFQESLPGERLSFFLKRMHPAERTEERD